MQNAALTILMLYWPQLLMVAGACSLLLLLYGSYVEPLLITKGIVKERFDEMSREEAVQFIDRLLNNSSDSFEIDDFICAKYRDPLIAELAKYVGEFQLPISHWTEDQLRDLQEFKAQLLVAEIEKP